jgi:hypothetical protein
MLSLSHHESGGCGRLDLAGPHSTRTGTASVKVIEIVGRNEFHTARANGFRIAGIQSNYMTGTLLSSLNKMLRVQSVLSESKLGYSRCKVSSHEVQERCQGCSVVSTHQFQFSPCNASRGTRMSHAVST